MAILRNENTKSLPISLKKKITTALQDIADEKMLSFLSASLNCEEIRRNAIKIINRETTYIARIPKKLDVAMNQGLLDFMIDSQTGENLGVLIDPKHKIKGHVQIEKRNQTGYGTKHHQHCNATTTYTYDSSH